MPLLDNDIEALQQLYRQLRRDEKLFFSAGEKELLKELNLTRPFVEEFLITSILETAQKSPINSLGLLEQDDDTPEPFKNKTPIELLTDKAFIELYSDSLGEIARVMTPDRISRLLGVAEDAPSTMNDISLPLPPDLSSPEQKLVESLVSPYAGISAVDDRLRNGRKMSMWMAVASVSILQKINSLNEDHARQSEASLLLPSTPEPTESEYPEAQFFEDDHVQYVENLRGGSGEELGTRLFERQMRERYGLEGIADLGDIKESLDSLLERGNSGGEDLGEMSALLYRNCWSFVRARHWKEWNEWLTENRLLLDCARLNLGEDEWRRQHDILEQLERDVTEIVGNEAVTEREGPTGDDDRNNLEEYGRALKEMVNKYPQMQRLFEKTFQVNASDPHSIDEPALEAILVKDGDEDYARDHALEANTDIAKLKHRRVRFGAIRGFQQTVGEIQARRLLHDAALATQENEVKSMNFEPLGKWMDRQLESVRHIVKTVSVEEIKDNKIKRIEETRMLPHYRGTLISVIQNKYGRQLSRDDLQAAWLAENQVEKDKVIQEARGITRRNLRLDEPDVQAKIKEEAQNAIEADLIGDFLEEHVSNLSKRKSENRATLRNWKVIKAKFHLDVEVERTGLPIQAVAPLIRAASTTSPPSSPGTFTKESMELFNESAEITATNKLSLSDVAACTTEQLRHYRASETLIEAFPQVKSAVEAHILARTATINQALVSAINQRYGNNINVDAIWNGLQAIPYKQLEILNASLKAGDADFIVKLDAALSPHLNDDHVLTENAKEEVGEMLSKHRSSERTLVGEYIKKPTAIQRLEILRNLPSERPYLLLEKIDENRIKQGNRIAPYISLAWRRYYAVQRCEAVKAELGEKLTGFGNKLPQKLTAILDPVVNLADGNTLKGWLKESDEAFSQTIRGIVEPRIDKLRTSNVATDSSRRPGPSDVGGGRGGGSRGRGGKIKRKEF